MTRGPSYSQPIAPTALGTAATGTVVELHRRSAQRTFTISCDECAMQLSSACPECVVTYVLSDRCEQAVAASEPVLLDAEQTRLVRLFGDAGLVPGLKFQAAEGSTGR